MVPPERVSDACISVGGVLAPLALLKPGIPTEEEPVSGHNVKGVLMVGRSGV